MSDALRSTRSAAETIEALEIERCRALVACDLDALDGLCSQHLVYTHTSTRQDTKQSYLQRVESGFYRYLEFERVQCDIAVVNQTAIVTGRLKSRVVVDAVPKRLDNMYLSVWALEGGRWQFLAYQPTPIPA